MNLRHFSQRKIKILTDFGKRELAVKLTSVNGSQSVLCYSPLFPKNLIFEQVLCLIL